MSAPARLIQFLKKRRTARVWLLAFALGACVHDPDDRCGPGQQVDPKGLYCVCLPGMAPAAEGGFCKPCGANEEVVGAKCECQQGFTRPAPGMPCERSAVGLGASCDAQPMSCKEARFPHCAAGGYCTNTGCTSSADCVGGYGCVMKDGLSFCRRPPVGQGKTCAADDECAGTEATLCDSLYTKQCLVQNCKTDDPYACHDGFRCCDLTSLGLKKNVCVPTALLPKCPGT